MAPCMVGYRYDDHVQLRAAAPDSTALLAWSSREARAPIGESCLLVPDLALGGTVHTVTNSYGDASLRLSSTSVPVVPGIAFIAQWLLFPSGFEIHASNAARVVIE